jgi:hypothetical protein
MGNTLKSSPMEHQQVLALYVWQFNSELVAVMHHQRIGCWYWQKISQQGQYPIPRIIINGIFIIVGFATWVSSVAICCKHPSIWYWLPSEAKPIGTRSLPQTQHKH